MHVDLDDHLLNDHCGSFAGVMPNSRDGGDLPEVPPDPREGVRIVITIHVLFGDDSKINVLLFGVPFDPCDGDSIDPKAQEVGKHFGPEVTMHSGGTGGDITREVDNHSGGVVGHIFVVGPDMGGFPRALERPG